MRFWGFFTWDCSSASKRGNLGRNHVCCAFVHQKEIRGFSIPVKFRGRCWYLLSFGLFLVFFVFFFIGLFVFFFHTIPGTSCGSLEMLNTVLNKCGTTPKWVFFLRQGGFVVCFLWQLLITKTLTPTVCLWNELLSTARQKRTLRS